jgi:CRP/FNR family cyclic AMP-dependent transcriptional regulator
MTSGKSEACEIASREGWLSQTPPAFKTAVLDRCILQTFEPDETIYMTGDTSSPIYGLISGGVSVSLATGERGPYFAHFFQPGTWFGEGPLISGTPRIAGISAIRETTLLQLSKQSMEEILRDDPTSWRQIALLTLAKLEVAISVVDDLMIRDSNQRLIAVLLRLGGCRHATPAGRKSIVVDVSQEDLAAMANLSRGTANAMLRKLEEAGEIAISYRQHTILKPDALRRRLGD